MKRIPLDDDDVSRIREAMEDALEAEEVLLDLEGMDRAVHIITAAVDLAVKTTAEVGGKPGDLVINMVHRVTQYSDIVGPGKDDHESNGFSLSD